MQERDPSAQPVDVAIPGVGGYRWRAAADALDLSDTLRALLGVTDAAPSLATLPHPEDRARVARDTEAALAGADRVDRAFRILRPDGTVRRVHDRAVVERDADGRAVGLRGVMMDVTVDDPLREAVARCAFGAYAVDADLRVLHANAVARAAFGGGALVGRDLGETLRAIWPERMVARALARFAAVLETGEPYAEPMMAERRRDTGAVEAYDWRLSRVVAADGRPGALCQFYDLSTHLAQEMALRDSEARLQLAYQASGMGAWDVDLRTGAAVWSPELYDLLGLDPETEATPELFLAHVAPEDRDRVRAGFERAVRERGAFEAEFRVLRADGETRHVAGRGRVMGRDGETPTRIIGVNYDVTQRRRAAIEDRRNAERLRSLIDGAVSFIGLLDAEGRVLEANRTALLAGGLTRDDVIGLPFWETYWWSWDPAVSARLREAAGKVREGEVVAYDEAVRMSGDTRMTICFMLSPVFGEDGAVREMVASGFDITERQRAEEHVRLLMREVNHRTQNAFALVQAIARQTQRRDPDHFMEKFAERLGALSAAQDLLVEGASGGPVRLADLARAQLAHFGETLDTQMTMEGPAVTLGGQAAQSLGLALHELGTNAAKHGALSRETGHVRLSWTLRGGELNLSWAESGGPPVAAPARTGFGSVVLGALTRSALKADTELRFDPGGLCWRLRCPVSALEG